MSQNEAIGVDLDEVLSLGVCDQGLELWRRKRIDVACFRRNQEEDLSASESSELISLKEGSPSEYGTSPLTAHKNAAKAQNSRNKDE
jgi:hypothetical protein